VRSEQFQAILPALTLAIGYAGTIATERLRGRQENRRLHRDAMVDFERTLLLDVQAAVYEYAGEMQDFAFALRGESDRAYNAIVGTAWRASARLEMLATRLRETDTRDAVGDVLTAGEAITSGSWPGDDEWSPVDRALLEKTVDALLESEQRAALLLGDRLRVLTYE
jgi:hypothetical protein